MGKRVWDSEKKLQSVLLLSQDMLEVTLCLGVCLCVCVYVCVCVCVCMSVRPTLPTSLVFSVILV